MYYSDEELSAFLDQELSAAKMDQIRESISTDPSLADRLALLSQVDENVSEFIRQIDRYPAPQKLVDLVSDREQAIDRHAVPSNVVPVGLWRKTERFMRNNIAIAASVALVVGIVVGGVIFENPARTENSHWAEINEVLNSLPSGERKVLASGEELYAQFSFTTRDNELCRSYTLTNRRARQDVACRAAGEWLVVASAYQYGPEVGEYGVASASPIVDAILEQLGAGATLSLAEERALFEQNTGR